MQGKLDQEDLGVALEVQLTMAFMQQGGELGCRVVHTGRDKFLGELSPKLGKPKKHPAYCVYLAYRLERSSAGEERAEEERAVSVLEATERSERGEEQHASERRPPHSYPTPSTEASSLKSRRDLTVHSGGAYSVVWCSIVAERLDGAQRRRL